MKTVITGAAGLVGQNLVPRLKLRGRFEIVAIDKHRENTRILRGLHPDIAVVEADLASDDGWQPALREAEAVVIAHAQIGGAKPEEFVRNNITATERLLTALTNNAGCRIVHISSSVVNSVAVDHYTESKKAQERLVLASGHPCVVLRPTLMFGWFDRKHLGWLARFMKKAPFFPVPGDGRYLRQPLYAGDFCDIVASCLERSPAGEPYNISGLERIDDVDLIRLVRDATSARAPIVHVPYGLFWLALQAYRLIDRDPPFTVKQLRALVTPDVFEVIDWPRLFGVRATPLADAVEETFRHPVFSSIALAF